MTDKNARRDLCHHAFRRWLWWYVDTPPVQAAFDYCGETGDLWLAPLVSYSILLCITVRVALSYGHFG